MSDSSDGVFRTDAGDLGLNIPLVLERKKRRLAEHVRQARVSLEGFEKAHVKGGKHYFSQHDQRKHRALKSDLEVVEEEYALVYSLTTLNEESIPR